jgi:hypothetical protein
MLPKLHRRTPSSAHTYRLLIFKELLEQIFVGFRLFLRLQSVLFATAKKRNYAAFSALRQAACFLLFAFAAKTSRNNCTSVATFADRCVRRGEPKIMLHSMSAVK